MNFATNHRGEYNIKESMFWQLAHFIYPVLLKTVASGIERDKEKERWRERYIQRKRKEWKNIK